MKFIRQKDLGLKIPKSVCVVGAGGTGYWTALLLAQVGIKQLVVFDPDTIEEHNRNRLPFRKKDVGRLKAEVLREFILETYEDCICFAYTHKFSPDFLIALPDYIVDCTDNFESQVSIFQWSSKMRIPYIRAGSKENHITVTDFVPQWESEPVETEEGKCGVTVSQWVVPQIMVAASVVRWICLGKKEKIEEV